MLQLRIDIIKKLTTEISAYSPIIIHGVAGVGKSFFVDKLCKELCANGTIRNFKIRASWDVLDGMIQALCEQKLLAWKNELLSSDILVIDDLHCLQGKKATAEELNKIFRSVHVPIIITTAIPICIENFPNEDMVSFLNQGTLIDLNSLMPTDLPEYMEATLKECEFQLTKEAFDWLVNLKISSLAVVNGMVHMLQLHNEYDGEIIDIKSCKKILAPLLQESELL